ncbi:uncharacterized protein LOC110098252 isoform X1 [Dendrobium catenatum]|uniref:Angiotensin-converting enzyme 2 n=1 Tax=Dendrobium catenatum TaxID=906689 RepID=A0A2I0X8Q4_9ASPA|nr:uncharacterized protein LOC110098252 isoform X1 [Dendrobium catenatum]PKU84282.1 hypothetical protein MA16_Dca002795 [Dendrobium catenatum]
MSESPASYIRMVQHLIEKCLLHRMNKEECIDALNKHANIKPVITSTVWGELEKENGEFFEAYERERQNQTTEAKAAEKVIEEPARNED